MTQLVKFKSEHRLLFVSHGMITNLALDSYLPSLPRPRATRTELQVVARPVSENPAQQNYIGQFREEVARRKAPS